MEKLSKTSFIIIKRITISVGISSLIGVFFFYMAGHELELFRTPSITELYGIFGWYSISAYLMYACFISITTFLLLDLLAPSIVNFKEE